MRPQELAAIIARFFTCNWATACARFVAVARVFAAPGYRAAKEARRRKRFRRRAFFYRWFLKFWVFRSPLSFNGLFEKSGLGSYVGSLLNYAICCIWIEFQGNAYSIVRQASACLI